MENSSIIAAIENVASRIEILNNRIEQIRIKKDPGPEDFADLEALTADIRQARQQMAEHQGDFIPNEFKDRAALAKARLDAAVAQMGELSKGSE